MAQPHSDLDRGDTVPTQGQVPVPAVCTSADDLGRGTQLGNFLLTDPLGMGGMGEVWKAWQVVEKRFVVLKFLVPELRSDCQAMKCVREAFARTSMLHHQHIGPVLSLEEDGRYGPYLVMGHVEGQPLSAYRAGYVARHRAFPLEEVVRVLSPVAEALDYSHACGVVHRDIKPQNILVDANKDEVHLIDFGLAAAVEGRRADQQQRGPGGPGTCPYMPPEQWRGEEARPQSDQYALAVVTYELLSGSRPFQGATGWRCTTTTPRSTASRPGSWCEASWAPAPLAVGRGACFSCPTSNRVPCRTG